jgi:hypothetical protein
VTRKSLTRGHVAFDTSGLFRKIAVRLDSPYLQQIASKRNMPTYAIACRTSIRRFKRANYQLIEQSNFVQNRNRFFVLINTCYSALQKGKEKRKKKKREVEETAANCVKVERRYGRKYGCDPAARGAHLHANWSFSPPPTLMATKLPTIGNHI